MNNSISKNNDDAKELSNLLGITIEKAKELICIAYGQEIYEDFIPDDKDNPEGNGKYINVTPFGGEWEDNPIFVDVEYKDGELIYDWKNARKREDS